RAAPDGAHRSRNPGTACTAHVAAQRVAVRRKPVRHSGPLVAPCTARGLWANGPDREAAAMSTWALVLAAGEGSRLRALTTHRGVAVPKQFCSLVGGPSLLEEAVLRAEAIVPRQRVC